MGQTMTQTSIKVQTSRNSRYERAGSLRAHAKIDECGQHIRLNGGLAGVNARGFRRPADNIAHGGRAPMPGRTWPNTFIVEPGRYRRETQALSPERAHALHSGGFPRTVAVRPHAFTTSFASPYTVASIAEFAGDHSPVVFGDGSKHLPYQRSRWVCAINVCFECGYQRDLPLAQISEHNLLRHERSGEPVQLLNDDTITRLAQTQQMRPCGPRGALSCAANAFLGYNHVECPGFSLRLLFDGCALSVPRVAINLSKSRAPHVSVRRHGPSMRAVSRLVNDSGEAFMHWQMRAVLLHLVTSRSLAFARQSPCAARLDPVGPVRPDHESFDRAEFQGWSHNLTKLECFIFTTRTTFGGA